LNETPIRRPAVGYAMVLTAATLFGFNGSLSKVILNSGISSYRLTEVRAVGAVLLIGAYLLFAKRREFRVGRGEVLLLVVFGLIQNAQQLLYFLTLDRLQVGIAILVTFTSPIFVALWARFVEKDPLRQRIWFALALSLAGLALVAGVYKGVSIDGLGLLFGVLCALGYTGYLVIAKRELKRRGSTSLLFYAFVVGLVFWSFAQPWWSFPADAAGSTVSLLGNLEGTHLPVWSLLLVQVACCGAAPYLLIVAALRHIPATHVALLATFEPVVGAIVAWAWLGETLGAVQLVGGALVIAGIVLAQTARE
jgi:drug/metabolite transporter (DMT)-like permease